MIYITGDVHGTNDLMKVRCVSDGNLFNKKDYLIVCGDFGALFLGTPEDVRRKLTALNKEIREIKTSLCELKKEKRSLSETDKREMLEIRINELLVDKENLERNRDIFSSRLINQRDYLQLEADLRAYYRDLPFKVLWIDGNHENFDLLKKYPVVDWKGGKVQKINRNCYHLCRGSVFDIDGFKIFAFGGAQSHDIYRFDGTPYRRYGISVWHEEMPSKSEMEYGFEELKKHGNKVDLILTHSLPTSSLYAMGFTDYKKDPLTEYLEYVNSVVDYKLWFSGHYHEDMCCSTRPCTEISEQLMTPDRFDFFDLEPEALELYCVTKDKPLFFKELFVLYKILINNVWFRGQFESLSTTAEKVKFLYHCINKRGSQYMIFDSIFNITRVKTRCKTSNESCKLVMKSLDYFSAMKHNDY